VVASPFTHILSLLGLCVPDHSFHFLSLTPTRCKGETVSRLLSERKAGFKQCVNFSESSARKMCALSEYCSNQHSTQISTKDSPSLPFFLHLMVLQFLYRCASNLALFVGINLLVLVTLRVRFFNVRTRGLCALVLPWADIAGGFATGYFLDQSRLSVKRRARLSWIFLMALNLGLWVWSGVLTKLLEGHGPGIDWTSGSIFNEIFALAIMFEFAALSTQTLIYWLISHSESDNDPAYR